MMPPPLPSHLLEKLLPALQQLAQQIKTHGNRSRDQLTQIMLSCGVNHDSALAELQTWMQLLNQARGIDDPDKKRAAVKNLQERGIPLPDAQKCVDIVSVLPTGSAAVRKPTNIKVQPGRLDFGVLAPGEGGQKQLVVSGGPGKASVTSPILRVDPVQFGPEPTNLTVYLQGGMGGTTLQEEVILEAEGVSRVRIEATGRWTAVVPASQHPPAKSAAPPATVKKGDIFDVEQVWNAPAASPDDAAADTLVKERAILLKKYEELHSLLEELRSDLNQQGKGLESNDALQYKRLLDLEARFNALQEGMESLEERIQIETLKSRLSELQRLLDSRFQHLNMGYRELERNLQTILDAQIIVKTAEVTEKIHNLESSLSAQVREIKSQTADLRVEFAELVREQTAQLHALNREQERFRQQLQEAESSYAALRETAVQFSHIQETIEEQITQVSEQLTEKTSRLAAELSALQSRSATLEEDSASISQGVDDLKEEQSRILSDLQSIGSHVGELMTKQESRDASQEERLNELEQILLPRIEAHSLERMEAVDSQVGKIQIEIDSLKQTSQELRISLQAVKESLERLEKAQASISASLSAQVTGSSSDTAKARPPQPGSYAPSSTAPSVSVPLEREASPRPTAPVRSMAWLEDWQRLITQLDKLKGQPLSPTLSKDLERLDSYYRVLVKQWDSLKSPADDPGMWTEWMLDSLDYHLYQPPQIVSLNEALPHDVRTLLEDVQLVILNAQMDRQRELRERLGLERIEGIVGQDKPIAYIIEPDPDYPPAETSEMRVDGTFCRIVPGHGGYRHQGKVLRKSLAVFYRYTPISEGNI
jgi:archaellum component FlaC